MKNNISFYRHFTNSHNHWKFKTLRRKYKWEGEGRFWCLNNIIADAEECRLNISHPQLKKAVAAELELTTAELDEFIEYLLQDCDLVQADDNGYLITEITQEIYNDLSEKRENERQRKEAYRKGENKNVPRDNANVPQDKKRLTNKNKNVPRDNANVPQENEQSIVDKSIVDKSIVESIEPKGSPAGPQEDQSKQDQNEEPPVELKDEYSNLEKSKGPISSFIRNKKPQFIEPYYDLWNLFATEKQLSKMISLTDTRKKKFKTRIGEKNFDFLEILRNAGKSNFILTSAWFNFDWIIENDTNYLKVIEGKFANDKPVHDPQPPGRSPEEILSRAREMEKQF